MIGKRDDNRWMERCPKYRGCSVNCCPLDPRNPERPSEPGDPEQRCKAHLRDRLRILGEAKAAGVEIPGGGFLPDEVGKDVEVLLAEQDERLNRQQTHLKNMRFQRDSRERRRGPTPAPTLGTSGAVG